MQVRAANAKRMHVRDFGTWIVLTMLLLQTVKIDFSSDGVPMIAAPDSGGFDYKGKRQLTCE